MKSIKGLDSTRHQFSQLRTIISESSFLQNFLKLIGGVVILGTIITAVPYFLISDPENRLGILQLIAACGACFGSVATIIAVVLAGYEFELAQRKPNLDIYFQENDGTLVKTLVIHHPNTSRYFNINLVLKNKSKAVAEFVKVEVDFQRTQRFELAETQAMRVFQKHQYFGFWKTNISEQTRLQALFNGGRNFILHSDDEESIGRIEIYVLALPLTADQVITYLKFHSENPDFMSGKFRKTTIF